MDPSASDDDPMGSTPLQSTNQQSDRDSILLDRTIPIIEENSEEANTYEFTTDYNRSRILPMIKYTRSILTLIVEFIVDLTNANNRSLLSRVARISISFFAYTMIYTSVTGQILWAGAYLMDHGWYILAATCSVVLLIGCGVFLAMYEWMWRWQERAVPYLARLNCHSNSSDVGYDRLRAVTVLDDDQMEDNLTFRGWIKMITSAFVYCLIWSIYCAVNVKIDFWITDLYMEARPTSFSIELRLVNCLEAAPIMIGASVLLYFAYPQIYRLQFSRELVSSASTTDAMGITGLPFSFQEDFDDGNENYTITVNDDEVVFERGMQNLII